MTTAREIKEQYLSAVEELREELVDRYNITALERIKCLGEFNKMYKVETYIDTEVIIKFLFSIRK
jgi:hypothetical protein